MATRVIVIRQTATRVVMRQGTAVHTVTINRGPPGSPGVAGDDGAPGLSAYEVAVTEGFIGTEAQWLASLVGADGADGTAGADGAPGSVWRNGSGVPSNGLGINGDYYLDTATGNVYAKGSGSYTLQGNIKGATGSTGAAGAIGATGSTGATGSAGSAGAAGSVWRSGSGAPSNGTGVDGDFYLRTSNGDVYTKASGTYSVTGNILGPTGATGADGADGVAGDDGTPGSVWRSGAGLPEAEIGARGDLYLNVTTGRVYRKWTKAAHWAFDADGIDQDRRSAYDKHVALIPLTEGSGNPLDVVSNTTGTLEGSAAWVTEDGLIGVALDGVDSYVALPQADPIGPDHAYEISVLFSLNTAALGSSYPGLYVQQSADGNSYNALYLGPSAGIDGIPPGSILCAYERYRVDSLGHISHFYLYCSVPAERLYPGLCFLYVKVNDFLAADGEMYLNGVELEPLPGYPSWYDPDTVDEDDPVCDIVAAALGVWPGYLGDPLAWLDGTVYGAWITGDPVLDEEEEDDFEQDPFGLYREAGAADPAGWYASVAYTKGQSAGFPYLFSSSTANSDPGGGRLRLNHADPTLVTAMYVSWTDALGADLQAEVQSWDDATSAVRARIKLSKRDDASVFALYAVTGSSTGGSLYDLVALTYIAGQGTFADADSLTVLVLPTGDKGADADVATEAAARASADTTLQSNIDGKQALHANLTALAGLVGASDRAAYFTGVGALSLYTLTTFGRTLAALADASALRTAGGLVIGTDVQAFHANLTAFAGLSLVADRLPYANGTGTLALATFTSFGRTVAALADYAALRTGAGLVIGTDVAAQGDSRFPTAGEKSALAGTSGTPGSGNKYVTDGDSRNTDSRAPSGSASGDLAGNYPSPTVAKIHETGGPTALTLGTVTDGQFLKRVGTTVVGATPGGTALADGDYGDVVVSGTGTVMTVDADAITNAKLADMADQTLKGNNAGSTGNPLDLTASQVRTLLALVIGTNAQAWNAKLDALAAFTSITDGEFVKRSGSGYASAAVVSPGWTVLSKAADQTVINSSAYADDTDLQFSMAANTKYRIRCVIWFDTTANGDYNYNIIGPASPTLVRQFEVSTIAGGTPVFRTPRTSYFGVGGNGLTGTGTTGGYIEFNLIVHNGANAGTFKYQFCQNSAQNDTGAITRAGSYLMYAVA